jgi:hypothetical protein
MSFLRQVVLRIALASAVLGAAAASAAPQPNGGEPVKVLHWAFLAAETGFDPAKVTDLYSRYVTSHLFDAPYHYDYLARPFKIVPNTAAAMPEASADYKTWTVRIRPGIYFDDDPAFGGKRRELVAADYAYSWKRFFDPATKSPSFTTFNQEGVIGLEELREEALRQGAQIGESDSAVKILDSIFKKIRPKLIQPTFLVDYPVDMLPLTKRKEDDPSLVDAFQMYAGGIELVKAFSELNDPLDQRARFEKQEEFKEEGEADAQVLDEDFLEAMEHGIPPAGGVGIGIDRLTMLFTGATNIKEVILFPTLKPRD